MKKTFQLLGETPPRATDDANTVMDLETSLAKVSLDIVKRRDPANLNHRLSLQEVRALSPAFSWDQYFKSVNAPQTDHYLVMTPEFFKGVNQLIATVPLESWKIYFRWQLVNASSSLLSEPFVEEKFDFYGRTLTGQKAQRARWRRCVQSVDRDLDEALGQEYVARAFAGDSKQRMLKLVHALEAALNADIQQVDWMSPATRKAAVAKLEKMEDKIGYPDHWRDYSSLKIVRGDALGNAYRSGEFELHRRLSRIGRPVDRAEWSVSPSVPNAYYDSQLNAITFPAAILQPPLFDQQSDDAANFGAIGAIIGHELTHGFDDQGRKFDGAGNLHDWWTAEDGKEFDKREQCIVDEYSGFEATEGVKLNGNLTLGENTADNGGLRIAFMALESILSAENRARTDQDGYSPEQRFFIAYGESLVLECDAPIPTHAGAVQPSFDAAGAGERSGLQYAGVSKSLRLQEGAAHGAGKRLSRLVSAKHVLRLGSRWSRKQKHPELARPARAKELALNTVLGMSSQLEVIYRSFSCWRRLHCTGLEPQCRPF